MMLLIAFKSEAQHFNLRKVMFDNIEFEEEEISYIYKNNIDKQNYTIDDLLNNIENNFIEKDNDRFKYIGYNLLNGYNLLKRNDLNNALKFCLLNEKLLQKKNNSKKNLSNKILKTLIYEKQNAYNLASNTLKEIKSNNPIEQFEIATYNAYLKFKDSQFKESFNIFKDYNQPSTLISNYDHILNFYYLSKTSFEIQNYKAQLFYGEKCDSIINQLKDDLNINSKIEYTALPKIEELKTQSSLNLTVAYRKNNKYNDAIKTIEQLITSEKKNKTSVILAELYVNKALTYTLMKEYNNATFSYYQAIKIYSELNDTYKKAETYNLLAKNTYLSEDYIGTINFCENSIEISKKQNDVENLAASYFILSETYAYNNDFANSQKYFKLYNDTKEIFEKNIQLIKTQNANNNNSSKLLTQQIESEILENERQNLELINVRMLSEQKEQELLLLKKENELNEKDFLNQKLEKEQIQRNLSLIKEQLEKETLQKQYIKINREREIKILENKNNQNQITLLNSQKSIFEKENELKTLEIKESNNKQKIYIVGFIILSILAMSLIYFLIKMRLQTKIIENNNTTITNTNKQLEENIKQVIEQKSIIESKNTVIEDSITYAQLIQQSLLVPESEFQRYFKESFIIYKPKEIVSGDFYLLQQFNNKIYIAMVDCTGHGVPGAMIAALAYQELTHLINTPHYSLGSILDDLNNRINELVNTKNHIGTDGMDLTLLCINTKNKIIKYSGAKGSFQFYNNNELIELKTDKKSIGHLPEIEEKFKYNVNEISYKSGDCLFLYTDGFVDQFSGITQKRIGSKNFRQLLIDNVNKSFNIQKNTFDVFIEQQKESQTQTDDITLIGLKLL